MTRLDKFVILAQTCGLTIDRANGDIKAPVMVALSMQAIEDQLPDKLTKAIDELQEYVYRDDSEVNAGLGRPKWLPPIEPNDSGCPSIQIVCPEAHAVPSDGSEPPPVVEIGVSW